ncbi:MAG TPA: phage tail protein [Acidocella sp.]|nr:phage tail protein [Acidocella sp.]
MPDNMRHIIRGAGGGGKGGGSGGYIAPDTLASRSYAKVAIAICEGEIEGIVGGMEGVYLNGTPLQNPGGDFNFTGISFNFQPGTQSQPYIPGFSDVENETQIGLTVYANAPLVQTITDPNANAVRVTIQIPALSYTNTSNGDVGGTSVTLAIDINTNGGGYVQNIYDTISGKVSSTYERSYLMNLTGTGPWNIRVRRVSPDSTSGNPVDAFLWSSFTEIINAKLAYPNTAVAYIDVDSGQFQSIPALSFNIKGLRIQVPSNYDPVARSYTGAWDGTFKIAWTNNPAWCFYDLLTATRYGLGNFISASQVDKWALYTIAQYCDGLVPDGFGGMEPRFTLNCYIQNYADAYKVLQDLASAFRGMPFWSTGSVTATQDAPASAATLFTPANVLGGEFTYTGASLKTRHTVALVTWNNMADQAKSYVEYVTISDADIVKYGEIITQVTAFGCTSRGQANRVGKWILYSEKYEGETVAFKTGLEGSPVRPGDIIKIADPVRGGQRLGGRLNAATANTITVDSPLVDASGNPVNPIGATVSVMALDGSVQQSTISSYVTAGTLQTLSLAVPLAVVPQSQALWMVELPTVQAQTFRLIQATRSERNEFTLTATAYNSSKYGYIDNGTSLVAQTVTDLTQPPAAPTGLVCTESLYSYQSTIFSMAALSWAAVPGAIGYYVGWAKDNGNYQFAAVPTNQFDLRKTDPGTYDFQVWTIGPNQRRSTTYGELTKTLYGKTLPPSDVTGLTYGFDQSNGLILSWAQAPDIDIYAYEVRRGASWAAGVLVGQSKTTTFTAGVQAIAGQTYWVAVLDTQGVYSVNPQSVAPVVPTISAPSVAAAIVGVNAVISWGAVAGVMTTDHYVISLDGGATVLTTTKGTSFTTKANFTGTETFSVAAVDIAGTVGTYGAASLTVNAPSAPTMLDQVIDNNVLLKWSASTGTLPVDHYVVSKGTTFAGSTLIGNISGLFAAVFETQAGTYTYWVVGVDAAGNQGTPAQLSVFVNPPPDYVLQYNFNSTFAGTRTNIATDTDGVTLLAPIDTATSYGAHFTNKSWASPNDQVTAGFPLFIEPALLTASYVESIDYGSVLPSSNVVVTLSSMVVSGAPGVSVTIAVSPDNMTWTTYSNTTNVFVSNFRYLKVTINITGTAGLDILKITSLNIKYQVKQKTDSGTVTCNASDSGGTTVNFNVTFLDVNSINVTAGGTSALTAIYNFSGGPDPTNFQILLFNAAGTRVNGTASWTARGV